MEVFLDMQMQHLFFSTLSFSHHSPVKKWYLVTAWEDVLSTSETQEQVLRRVEVPVQNDCEQMGPWSDPATPLQPLAPAGAHPPAFLPGIMIY